MKEFSVLQVLREFSHPGSSTKEVESTGDSNDEEEDDEDISVDEFDGDDGGGVV